MKKWLKRLLWFLGFFFLFVVGVALIFSYALDEPLRAWFEKRINANLKGYRVQLADVDVNPFDLAIIFRGLTIVQEKHPEPPVAFFTTIEAGVHWRPILSARIVGDIDLDRPKLHLNLAQLREETASQVEVEERGWQEALESVYPLKINLLTVKGGELTYIDQDPRRPLRVSRIALTASNIRNIASPQHVYPSLFDFKATIFEKGKLRVDGKANFLAQPHPGMAAEVTVQNLPLDHFAPILERYHVSMESGRIDLAGEVEYAPKTRVAHLKKLHLQDLRADYIHTPAAEPKERKAARKTQAAVQEVSNNPQFQLRIADLQVRGEAGLINKATDPDYRVFLANIDLRMDNLSNHFSQGPAELKLNGDFMGSGPTTIRGTFRPEDKGPDFDLNLKIEETQLTDMNDLFRAYGNFDIEAGTFTLFSELQVRNEAIDGYVKPFFKNLNVYDRRQDAEKSLFRQMYEGLVEGVSDLLSRDPQDRVAARTDMSGKVENPRADTWQLVATLIQNAFFRAILPGFDQAISE
ncbi:MAG: DUF748 domain-containing protein [Desulfobacteraceae bacterium]|nr:MAG: DUF748 domain-containing protein [Desulfobacteraceae bacterium]